MAKINIENKLHYIHATISGKISSSDIVETVKPNIENYLNTHNTSKAVLINAYEFDGWENFSAFSKHMHLISENHHKIDRIALVGPRALHAVLLQFIGMLAVSHFEMFDSEDAAAQWLRKLELAA